MALKTTKQTKGYSYLLINLLLFFILFWFSRITRICWDFFFVGLSSTEISRIPVSGSAGQGTPLGTSQSGDFSFRFPSTQSGK